MFWHVYTKAKQCQRLTSVWLATDDERIFDEAFKLGIGVIMTDRHQSGSDRCMEAAKLLNLPLDSIIVNIQGDEPLLNPEMIDQLIEPFNDPNIQVTTLAREINSKEAYDPDIVKVVFRKKDVWFTREPHKNNEGKYYGQIGLYAYRYAALKNFTELEPTENERRFKLEQLRLIDNGVPIHVVLTEHKSIGVDRPEDIEKVENILKERKMWSGISNTARCPVCNKFGSPKYDGYCKLHIGQKPICRIRNCGSEVVMFGKVPSRYCKDHLEGNLPDPLRKNFNQPLNSPLQGWRQEVPERFEIVNDRFTIES